LKTIKLSRIQYLLKAEIPEMIKYSKSSDEFHDNLRNYLLIMAEEFECNGKIKYETFNKRKIDVVWLDDIGNIRLAFEVDGGLRKRSIKRLVDLVADNKIWLYYGNSKKINGFIKQYDSDNSIILLNLGKIRKILRDKKLSNKS
jgi:hypothetical protein